MYIRTKDWIYEVEQSQLEDDEEVVNCEYGQIGKLEIKRKSDTIEELCDEFVMTHYFEETNYTKCEVLKEDKDLMIKAVRLKKINNKNKAIKNEFNIYGAIWVEGKGLIYVAKMDDKGELELV